MTLNRGVLYVVATPIGNLADITDRARQMLEQVDIIAAEDTRTTSRLLSHIGVKKPLIAYHEHNEVQRLEQLQRELDQGKSVALVSDAGTPLISDPGYPLVQRLRSEGYEIVPIPGPSALVTALSVAGIATDRFCFEGFLPPKSQARKNKLKELKNEPRTLVFYESCHRIKSSLEDFRQVMGGERRVTVCRELTKRFETIASASLDDILIWVQQPQNQKGEFVIVLEGQKQHASPELQDAGQLLATLLQYLSPAQASAAAAQITGLKKKQLYQLALEQQQDLQQD